MNILMLGVGDAGLDDPHSEPVMRQLEYARRAEGHIDLVVDTPSAGTSEYGALTVHRTGAGRLGYPSAAYRLAREIARHRMPDLITAQDPFATALVGSWLRRALRRPLLIQNHSSVLFNRYWIAERPAFYRVLHALARFLLPRADAWRVVNTREQRMYIERLGLPAGRVWCIPVPCDLRAYEGMPLAASVARARQRLPASGPIVLWAGRPVRFKRLPLLYSAFADLRRSFPDAWLVIAGRRNLAQEDLAGAEQRAGVDKATSWIEDISHDDLAGLYGVADVFLLTSIYEGFGRVLVEAGAVGLPAVATATAGAADILREGETGFLVPVEDAPALARKACELLADGGLRKRMGTQARQHIHEHFDPSGLFDAVVAQWREAAAVGMR
jgi:glycosyltransferase involved in cell wall biosynthesis